MSEVLHRYGEVRGAKNKDSRVREFVISTEAVDRHGTIVDADGGDVSGFAGTAFYQHDTHTSDPDMALGPAKVWKEGREWIGSIDFEDADLNPTADKVMRKIDNGTLRNVSIGFIPIDGKYEGEGENRIFRFTKWELLEFSVVGVPSNKDAQLRSNQAYSEAIREIEPKEPDKVDDVDEGLKRTKIKNRRTIASLI